MNLLDVMTSPWVMEPKKFGEIQEVYRRHLTKEKLSAEELAAVRPSFQEPGKGFEIVKGVAVIDIQGVLAKKANLFMDFSGGTSMQMIGQRFREAMEAKEVTGILLKVDSPGGTVDGTEDLAKLIFESRGNGKSIVTFVDGAMASGALWIGSAADRVVISGETSQVGSIGVVATHVDMSEREKQLGIKTTEVVSSEFKREPSHLAPLSDKGHQVLQETVNQIHRVFVGEVARFRGVGMDELEEAGNGKMFFGQRSIEVGLADEVGNFHELLADMKSVGFNRRKTFMAKKEDPLEQIITQEQLDLAVSEAKDQAMSEMNVKLEEAKQEGHAQGVQEERARITGIEEHAKGFPGHEKLIAEMKKDGTTPEEAASKILNAERDVKAKALKNLNKDAPSPIDQVHDDNHESESVSQRRDRLVEEYMTTEKCDYKTALIEVSRLHPDLFVPAER